MLHRIVFLFVLSISAHFVAAQVSEEQAVKAAYNSYKTAILNDRGEEAVRHVDSRTIQYYEKISGLVREADSSAIESLSLMDKLMVLMIRHRATKAEILKFDGAGLLMYAFENGMVGKNSVATNTIGDVVVNDDFATGQLVARGQPTPHFFHFYREEGQWKIDLTAIFPASALVFQEMVEESGEEENEFLFSLLEMLTGKEPGKEVWMPVSE